MLPPGITLTRVDPTSAEGLRAKKEAISRVSKFIFQSLSYKKSSHILNVIKRFYHTQISQPAPAQYQQPTEYQRPPPFISGMPMQQNGLIMVDPMQNLMSSNAAAIAADNKQMQQSNKKNRKNRKKNKNKTEEENVNDQQPNSGQPKIVTLRNPLFQGANDASRGQQAMPLQQRNQVPLNINQPASIIKNDNGMFTIRNTALHQAFMSNGVAQNYRPYSNEMYQPQPQQQQQQQPQPQQHDSMKADNYSYFSGVANQPPPPQQPVAPPIVPSNGTSASSSSSSSMASDVLRQTVTAPKPTRKAIGSERRGCSDRVSNEHKQQQQLYSGMNGDMYNSMHMDSKRSSYSSFDGSANFTGGFNSDFIGAAQSNASIPTTMQNQYYHLNGGFSFNNQNQNDTTASLFGNRTLSSLNNSHCCDDSPPAHAHDPYGAPKITTEDNSFFKKFDDDSFLHGIHSGQRLNSEVRDCHHIIR